MEIVKDKNIVILKLNQNEELISSLKEYAIINQIFAGHFIVIGAASKVTVSYYNLVKKEYQDKVFLGDVEILSISGNIANYNGEIKIHAHGSFAREDYSVFGGHIQTCIISATGEIHLTKIDGEMKREYDKKTGLTILVPTDSKTD